MPFRISILIHPSLQTSYLRTFSSKHWEITTIFFFVKDITNGLINLACAFQNKLTLTFQKYDDISQIMQKQG